MAAARCMPAVKTSPMGVSRMLSRVRVGTCDERHHVLYVPCTCRHEGKNSIKKT